MVSTLFAFGIVLTAECKQLNNTVVDEKIIDGSSGSCDSSLVIISIYISISLFVVSLWKKSFLSFKYGLFLLLLILHRPRNTIFLLCLYVLLLWCSIESCTTNTHTHTRSRYGATTCLTLYFEKCNLKKTHWWVPIALGRCGFFALGNSHLISTIDIAGAYTGVSSFSIIVPILLWIISETGPIVGLVTFLRITKHDDETRRTPLEFIAIMCISCTLMNAAVLLYMRHHLFIWTVFAPRFCYEVVYLLTHVVLCTGTIIFL